MFDEIADSLLEYECPEKMNQIFQNHRAFHYYPNPFLIIKFLDFYVKKKNHKGFTDFYNSIADKYFINKSSEFVKKAIEFSYLNSPNIPVSLFLHELDYRIGKFESLSTVMFCDKHLLKDTVIIKLVEQYLNFHPEHSSVGVKFGLLIHYLSNALESQVTQLIQDINNQIEKAGSQEINEEIHYNHTLRVFIRSHAGGEVFTKLNKQILKYFTPEMNLDIFDANEKSKPEPEELSLATQVKETAGKKKGVIKKEQKAVASFILDVPSSPWSKAPMSEEDRERAKTAKKKDNDDLDDDKGKKPASKKK